MIVSASYRTDIPAFYGDWFLNRLDAGFCWVRNPYSDQMYRVSLLPDDVDGFVFWTKNAGPFLDALRNVHRRGFPFVVQYSMTAYPRQLEFSVMDVARGITHARQIADQYGPRVVVWRYDPILFTSLTEADDHRRSFERLAAALEGTVDEVVISFAQIYAKTRRSLERAARHFSFTWNDPPGEYKQALAADLARMAAAHGMRLAVCSQNAYVPQSGFPARCIDAGRLSDVAGRPIRAPQKGNRPDCACTLSRDIGAYDTCPHGCVYCYAVQDRGLARNHRRQHSHTTENLSQTRLDVEAETVNHQEM
ncbi:MAG: DUF1848 domain-containing protein [Parvularculaceae bacterium]|nr:DUF1848 domain-containing protein [Parvularculaceae bacterium]